MNPINFVDSNGLSTITINMTRNRINSKSITGLYNVELSDYTSNYDHPFVQMLGQGLFNRSMNISGVTIERSWLGNKKNVSSIPVGNYEAGLSRSNIALNCSPSITELLHLKNVPGNRNWGKDKNTGKPIPERIRIHNGNYGTSGTGCIMIGTGYNPQQNENKITNSCTRVVELMNFINDVKYYDDARMEKTNIYVNITADVGAILGNIKNQWESGSVSKIGLATAFLELSHMLSNPEETMNDLEKKADSFFKFVFPELYKIKRLYYSDKETPFIDDAHK
jgi:hypothetical protein